MPKGRQQLLKLGVVLVNACWIEIGELKSELTGQLGQRLVFKWLQSVWMSGRGVWGSVGDGGGARRAPGGSRCCVDEFDFIVSTVTRVHQMCRRFVTWLNNQLWMAMGRLMKRRLKRLRICVEQYIRKSGDGRGTTKLTRVDTKRNVCIHIIEHAFFRKPQAVWKRN